SFGEILLYSGDLSSFVTASPLLSLWGWTSSLNEGERQLFPGLTIPVLALAGVLLGVQRTPHRDRQDADRLGIVSWFLLIVSIALSTLALVIRLHGPGRIQLGWLTVSFGVVFKPLSLAIAAYIAAAAFDPRMRAA